MTLLLPRPTDQDQDDNLSKKIVTQFIRDELKIIPVYFLYHELSSIPNLLTHVFQKILLPIKYWSEVFDLRHRLSLVCVTYTTPLALVPPGHLG